MLQPSRRSFLGTLAAAVPAAGIVVKQKSNADPAFRFAVAGCEFDLTVKPYGKISSDDFALIDEKTKRRFWPARCRMPLHRSRSGPTAATSALSHRLILTSSGSTLYVRKTAAMRWRNTTRKC